MHRSIAPLALAALAFSLCWLPTTETAAQIDLATKAVAKLTTRSSGGQVAKVQFKGIPGGDHPFCPNSSSLRLIAEGFDSGELELDCANWSGAPTARYRPSGSEGFGLHSIIFRRHIRSGKLKVKFSNKIEEIVSAPTSFLELRLAINGIETRYCGRFDAWRRNADGRILSEKTSVACPAYTGERAFFDTLTDTADSSDSAVAELGQAIADVPGDGRAAWLLGMVHPLRFGRIADYAAPSQEAQDEALAARAALELAVPLLAGDARIPGFSGAAGYLAGVVTGDAVLEAEALQQMRDAIVEFPEFNVFDFAGTVPGVVTPSDPLFAEAVAYLDVGLATGCSPFNNPTLCGNAGKAAHNVEGTGLLFGDILAKNGDRNGALEWYDIARLWDDGAGGNDWDYRFMLDDRLANLDARIALYADSDPSNDPRVAGTGAENCLFCHQAE